MRDYVQNFPVDPAEIRVVGTIRLLGAIDCEIDRLGSLRTVYGYMQELLPLLFAADAVCIELRHPLNGTLLMPDSRVMGRHFNFDVSVELHLKGENVGSITLYYDQPSSEVGPQGRALLEFFGNRLCQILSKTCSAQTKIADLSAQERRVLSLLHCTTEEILDYLNISHETLRTHCKRIFKKLGVHCRSDAVKVAHQSGLIDWSKFRAI